MDTRDFLVIRRAYNLVRKECPRFMRLTFEEFATLCHLHLEDKPVGFSKIAKHQGAQRPTLTRRVNRLANLGFVVRTDSEEDKRVVFCGLTERGEEIAQRIISVMAANIEEGSFVDADNTKIMAAVDAISTMPCTAADLVMLVITLEEDNSTRVTRLVDQTGLLQPTVSMAVTSLEDAGYLRRAFERLDNIQPRRVVLEDAGRKRALELCERVHSLELTH